MRTLLKKEKYLGEHFVMYKNVTKNLHRIENSKDLAHIYICILRWIYLK